MKRIVFAASLAVGLIFTSCEKEEEIIDDKQLISFTENTEKEILNRDGVLSFNNWSTFYETAAELSFKRPDELKEWYIQYGNFKSLETLYKSINEEEIKFQENYFRGIPEDISVSELIKMGKPLKHTTVFNENERKGIISRVVEKDLSEGFVLNVYDKVAALVLNEEGLVYVGGKLYLFNNEKHTEISEKANLIELRKNSFTTKAGIQSYTWHRNSGWRYDGSKKRYNLVVYGSSAGSSTSVLKSVYFIESKGEKKRWGNWNTRNDYHPIYRISGNWQYKYSTLNNLAFTSNIHYSIPDNDSGSPYSYFLGAYGGSNHFKAYVSPNGLWTLNNKGENFYTGMNVYNASYLGQFYGGPSGYSINL